MPVSRLRFQIWMRYSRSTTYNPAGNESTTRSTNRRCSATSRTRATTSDSSTLVCNARATVAASISAATCNTDCVSALGEAGSNNTNSPTGSPAAINGNVYRTSVSPDFPLDEADAATAFAIDAATAGGTEGASAVRIRRSAARMSSSSTCDARKYLRSNVSAESEPASKSVVRASRDARSAMSANEFSRLDEAASTADTSACCPTTFSVARVCDRFDGVLGRVVLRASAEFTNASYVQ